MFEPIVGFDSSLEPLGRVGGGMLPASFDVIINVSLPTPEAA
jgi:hypothetical protein